MIEMFVFSCIYVVMNTKIKIVELTTYDKLSSMYISVDCNFEIHNFTIK